METKRTNLVLRLAALNEHENQQLGSSSNTFYNFNFNKQTAKMKLKDKIISLLMTTVVMLSFTLTAWGQFGMTPTQIAGWSVATHSSGTWLSGGLTGGPVVGLVNTRNCDGTAPFGANWVTAMTGIYHGPGNNWNAANMGQVFGVALDKNNNIYTTSTSVYNHVGEPFAFGPAGSGGVYKISYSTGAISNIVTTSPFTTTAIASIGTSKLPNSGPGLGNICYDRDNDRLYVTNLEDGTIYRMTTAGVIDAVYDPSSIPSPLGTTNPAMAADGGTAGFAPLGERLWGIAYNPIDKRIYYSVWVEGGATHSATTYNVIRSVSVNPTGFLPSTDQLEFKLSNRPVGVLTMPDGSMPVSDIEFSSDGKKMLVAECGVWDSYSQITPQNTGHDNRVLEYKGASGSWVFNQEIFIGNLTTSRANAAGGVDYGLKFLPQNGQCGTPLCDSIVWATGNYLVGSTSTNLVYGLQSAPWNGNTPATVHSLGHFVDLNGNLSTNDKTQIGDVDVFRGECGGKPQQQPNCDSIHVELLPLQSRAGCCWQLTYSNPYPNAFTSLTTTIVSGGGSFGSVSAGSLNIGAFSPTSVTWVPFSGSFLPVGTFPTSTAGSFCLNLITAAAVPQVIVFTWSGPNGLICKDTMKLQCQPPIRHECVDLKEVKISCKGITPNGNIYNVSFMVFNNSAFPMDKLVVLAPSGFTLTPGTPFIHYFSPPVPPAGSGTISFQISGTGAVNGANLCLNIKMSDTALLKMSDTVSLEQDKHCCIIDTCFKLPECKDCCKDFRKIVGTSTITTNANGNVVNGLLIGAGPTPISKLTIQLVSSSIKVSCKKGAAAETSAGWQNANATLGPVLPNPIITGLPLYSQTSYEGVWGINTSGVLMLPPVALSNFNVQFPPPPCNSHGTICWDSVKYCLKISFTDTMCVTCDTTICFTIRRAGRPWWSCYHLPAGDVIGSRKGIASPEDNKGSQLMSSSSEMSLSTLKMKDDKTGTLSVALPSAEETGGVVAVKQICTEAVFGSRLTRFDGIDARDFSACSNKAMKSGESRDIPLEIDNYSKQKMVGLVVRMFFTQEGYTDVSVFEDTVYAVIPGKDQVQPASLGEGQAPVKSAKTYSLYFAGNPKDEVNIDRIVVRTPKDATILAVGPFRDKNSVSMQLNEDSSWTDGKVGMRFFPEKPATDPTNLVALKNRIEPTFITISSEQKEITIECDSYDNNGTFIGTSTVVLRSPLSNVETGKDKDAANKAVLYPIYPNPTMNSISIQFALPSGGDKISLEMYDAEGKELPAIFSNQAVSAGEQVVVYNANNLPNGKYFVRLVSSKGTSIQSFTVVR